MTMRESLVVLLSSVFLADNLRHVFRKLHMLKISVHKYTIFNNMMILLAQSSSVRYLTELNELENAVAERFLKHEPWFDFMENVFTTEFLRKT